MKGSSVIPRLFCRVNAAGSIRLPSAMCCRQVFCISSGTSTLLLAHDLQPGFQSWNTRASENPARRTSLRKRRRTCPHSYTPAGPRAGSTFLSQSRHRVNVDRDRSRNHGILEASVTASSSPKRTAKLVAFLLGRLISRAHLVNPARSIGIQPRHRDVLSVSPIARRRRQESG